MRVALGARMAGVTRYEDLDCWKVANELKCRVYEIVDASPAKEDFRFRNQLTDAASSGPSNISEGFACYRHKESARYARIAKASLTETHNHLNDGVTRRHWSAEQIAPLLVLANRAIAATVGWIRYLETTKEPPAYWERKKERSTRRGQ
jgi:four helix bundle protein